MTSAVRFRRPWGSRRSLLHVIGLALVAIASTFGSWHGIDGSNDLPGRHGAAAEHSVYPDSLDAWSAAAGDSSAFMVGPADLGWLGDRQLGDRPLDNGPAGRGDLAARGDLALVDALGRDGVPATVVTSGSRWGSAAADLLAGQSSSTGAAWAATSVDDGVPDGSAAGCGAAPSGEPAVLDGRAVCSGGQRAPPASRS